MPTRLFRPVGQILANRLSRANKRRSWRQIAEEDYDGKIPAGTLARIKTSGGTYLPQKPEYRALLGLPAGQCGVCRQRIVIRRMVKPVPVPPAPPAEEPPRRAITGAWKLNNGRWGTIEERFGEMP